MTITTENPRLSTVTLPDRDKVPGSSDMDWAEKAYSQNPPPGPSHDLKQSDPSRQGRWVRRICATFAVTLCAVLVALIVPGTATAPSPPNVGYRTAPTATLRHHESGEQTRTVAPLTTLFPLWQQIQPSSTPLLLPPGNLRR